MIWLQQCPFCRLRCHWCFIKKSKHSLEVYRAGLQGNVLLFCFLSLTRSLHCCRLVEGYANKVPKHLACLYQREQCSLLRCEKGPAPSLPFLHSWPLLNAYLTVSREMAYRMISATTCWPAQDLLQEQGSSCWTLFLSLSLKSYIFFFIKTVMQQSKDLIHLSSFSF